MQGLPPTARWYLIVLLAATCGVGLWYRTSLPTLVAQPILVVACLLAFTLALSVEIRLEIRPDHAIGLTVSESVIILMLVLLGQAGFWVVLVGTILVGAFRRRPLIRNIGNSAMHSLTYAASLMVYMLIPAQGVVPFGGWTGVLSLIMVALTMYISNIALVGTMIGLATGQSVFGMYHYHLKATTWVHFLIYPLGALLAAGFTVDPMLFLYAITVLVLAVRAFQAVVDVQTETRRRQQLAEERAALAEQVAEQQRELARNNRLQELGTFAARLAHEVRNALTGVIGNADLGPLLPLASEKDDVFQLISRIGRRTNTVMESILTFARERPPDLHVQPLQPVIADAVALVSSDILNSGIELTCMIDPDVPPLACDGDQISQVVINLLTNARDACRGVGNITVSMTCEQQDVLLVVADTGEGMPPDVLEQLFQPFKTTKKHGNGLGMAICYGIIQNHCGTITVHSAVGQGTKIEVRLPMKQQEVGNNQRLATHVVTPVQTA
jgi:signal transduction histidine kinase